MCIYSINNKLYLSRKTFYIQWTLIDKIIYNLDSLCLHIKTLVDEKTG